jgi:hypothetical protein
MKEQQRENEYAKFWIQDGWLLCIQYNPGLVITLDAAIDCTKIRMELSNGVTRPMFTDARNAKDIDKEARDYLGKHGTEYVKAGAFLIKSQLQLIVGNLFFAFNKPPVPSKLFMNEDEALRWLEQFKP